jgi:hypothetical protein
MLTPTHEPDLGNASGGIGLLVTACLSLACGFFLPENKEEMIEAWRKRRPECWWKPGQ